MTCKNCQSLQGQLDEESSSLENALGELEELRRRAQKLDDIQKKSQALVDELTDLL